MKHKKKNNKKRRRGGKTKRGFGIKRPNPCKIAENWPFLPHYVTITPETENNHNKKKQPKRKKQTKLKKEGLGELGPFGPHLTLSLPKSKPTPPKKKKTKLLVVKNNF